MIRLQNFVGALAAGLFFTGVAALAEEAAPEATAMIHNAGKHDQKISGTASFTQLTKGVKIVIDVDGLAPGKHGIHIHEKPDLTAPDLSSAGPHYNPDGAEHHHGGPADATRHAGDLGNIEADEKGHGHLECEDADLSVTGKNSVVGHSLIIHEKEDDLKTDPSGNSGARIAGGAIETRKGSGKPQG